MLVVNPIEYNLTGVKLLRFFTYFSSSKFTTCPVAALSTAANNSALDIVMLLGMILDVTNTSWHEYKPRFFNFAYAAWHSIFRLASDISMSPCPSL